jgi:hypothetical protein
MSGKIMHKAVTWTTNRLYSTEVLHDAIDEHELNQ